MSFTVNPLISVVIPTYKRPDDLKKCLISLGEDVQFDAHIYEIIVTDDSKSDDSKILVEKKFPNVSWGRGKQNGPAANRNAGVKRAKGEWIVFIDDDCIADKYLITSYHNAIQDNPGAILFEGRIYPDRPRKTWAECCPENSNGNMFWTSNLCVKKEVFYKVGGFDERFRIAYEDIDFAHRIHKGGFKTKFIKDASACHPWRTLKIEGNNWKPRGFELSELKLFIKKHPDAKNHNSPQVYLRHLIRMLSMDMIKCLLIFKARGLGVLLNQIVTTTLALFITLQLKFDN